MAKEIQVHISLCCDPVLTCVFIFGYKNTGLFQLYICKFSSLRIDELNEKRMEKQTDKTTSDIDNGVWSDILRPILY